MKHTNTMHCLKVMTLFILPWLVVTFFCWLISGYSFIECMRTFGVIALSIIIWIVLMIGYIADTNEHAEGLAQQKKMLKMMQQA
jgi:uncharacterized membrane protein (GlpM family)